MNLVDPALGVAVSSWQALGSSLTIPVGSRDTKAHKETGPDKASSVKIATRQLMDSAPTFVNTGHIGVVDTHQVNHSEHEFAHPKSWPMSRH